MMSIDVVAAAVRALSLVLLMQATGIALFIVLFTALEQSAAMIVRWGKVSALLAVLLVLAFHLLQAGRMTGEFTGVLDMAMQRLALSPDAVWTLSLRISGLMLIGLFVDAPVVGHSLRRMTLSLGAVCVAVSFAMTGHSVASIHAQLLRPVLAFHVLVAAFWFGALVPLLLVLRHESSQLAAILIHRFSSIASVWVPLIAVAGVVMAAGLLPQRPAFTEPYELLLVAKALLFAVLILPAALNRWRYGPALMGANAVKAQGSLRRSVFIEYVLIITVLCLTAVMTLFFSP